MTTPTPNESPEGAVTNAESVRSSALLADLLRGPMVTERTLQARLRTYHTLREQGGSHEDSLAGAKQLLHVG